MNLPETIYAHARVLPVDLQRQTLDFITWLEQRYALAAQSSLLMDTTQFLQHFAGSLGDDFPDDVDTDDMGNDVVRESL